MMPPLARNSRSSAELRRGAKAIPTLHPSSGGRSPYSCRLGRPVIFCSGYRPDRAISSAVKAHRYGLTDPVALMALAKRRGTHEAELTDRRRHEALSALSSTDGVQRRSAKHAKYSAVSYGVAAGANRFRRPSRSTENACLNCCRQRDRLLAGGLLQLVRNVENTNAQ